MFYGENIFVDIFLIGKSFACRFQISFAEKKIYILKAARRDFVFRNTVFVKAKNPDHSFGLKI